MRMKLSKLPKNQPAEIMGFDAIDQLLEIRLREIGFAEGDTVQCMHFGLLGGDPIMVKLNGALIAMRKGEAMAIQVKKL